MKPPKKSKEIQRKNQEAMTNKKSSRKESIQEEPLPAMATDDDHHPGFPLIFELVRTPEYRFFHCRHCSCCLALHDALIKKADINGLFTVIQKDELKVDRIGNVRITSADVHCLQCNHELGIKVINVTPSAGRRSNVPGQYFWLTMTEMMFWNGHEEGEASFIEPPNGSGQGNRLVEKRVKKIYRL